MNELLRQICSFAAIGLVSSASYLGAMSLSVEFLHLSVAVAAFLAFCAGTAISYLGNTLLTFRAPMTGNVLGRLLLIVLMGMVRNQVTAFLVNSAGVHYVLIAATVFVVVPAFSFIGHSLFTYRAPRT
jgi:putative flippase GtrA